MPQQPVSVANERQLFIDRRFIDASSGVELAMNPPRLRGLAIAPDRPWEGGGIGFCASVMAHEGALWLFYRATAPDGRAGVCLATSDDGLQWRKRALGVVEYGGSRVNNLVFHDVGEAVVFHDPHGAPDAAFKAVVVNHWPDRDRGGISIYTSPDGVHWTAPPDRVLPVAPDTANQAAWDPRLGKYVAYIRVWDPLRRVGRVEMDDITAPWPYDTSVKPYHIWGEDKIAVPSREVPCAFGFDGDDPPDADVYNAAAVRYPWAADAYFIFPSAYNHFPEPPAGRFANDGLLDIQMAVSRDGVAFERISRQPYIGLAPAGGPASGQLYMAVGMVERGEEILQFYAGYANTHGDPVPEPERRPIGGLYAAAQRRDGFVSADFAYGGGSLTTPPMTFAGGRIELNLDCSGMGLARVEIQDAAGVAVPGFGLGDCDVLYGNQPRATVTWRGEADVSHLAGTPVRLHIEARAAKLYAFQFRAD